MIDPLSSQILLATFVGDIGELVRFRRLSECSPMVDVTVEVALVLLEVVNASSTRWQDYHMTTMTNALPFPQTEKANINRFFSNETFFFPSCSMAIQHVYVGKHATP